MTDENKDSDNDLSLIHILDSLKQFSGIIIAASFSSMVFLLSLIKERTLFLDFGIFILLISIILKLELFSYISHFTQLLLHEKERISDKIVEKKLLFANNLQLVGEKLFFLGVVHFLFHFNLVLLSIIVVIYLIVFIVKDLIGDIQVYKEDLKFLIICVIIRISLLVLIIMSIILIYYLP